MSTLYQSELGSRPFPLDRERRRRVMIALAERDITISALARSLHIAQAVVSKVVNGRRFSQKTEQRIADFLGKPAGELFPERSAEELAEMRKAETSRRAASQQAAARKGTAA